MKTINLKSTSRSSAEADDIILRENTITRLIFRPLLVDNPSDSQASVKGCFIFQRKSPSEKWEDSNGLLLNKLKSGEGIKLELKSGEIKKLFDNLSILKSIYAQYGIVIGETDFHINEGNIENVLLQLSKLDNKDLILSELAKLQSHEIENLAESFLFGLQLHKRMLAISKFEEMLKDNLVESEWQKWFQENSWVLGTEFVEVLKERAIDTKNITDYLMKAYDGFLDIIEIKRPEGDMLFWGGSKDHGNLIPSSSLIKAITQATKYIYEIEREANSLKFIDHVGVKVIKPRCILIFGRSSDWKDEHREAYRILNSSYNSLTIMTYDHVLERAKRMVKIPDKAPEKAEKNIADDISF